MLTIETDRLLLRDHRASDLADYQRWLTLMPTNTVTACRNNVEFYFIITFCL